MTNYRTLLTAAVVAALAISAALFHENLLRLHKVCFLFHEKNIVQNFRSMDNNVGFPYSSVEIRGATVAAFTPRHDDTPDLPTTFNYSGTTLNLKEWIEEKWTTGLVVIRQDQTSPTTSAQIMHESYYRGNDAQSRCVSWSVCKSIISAMVGIAVDRGIIRDIVEDTVTDYVPELKGSGYDGVSLKHLLEMTSGVAFDEDYFAPFSDINVMGYTLALGGSMDRFTASLKREREPGIFNHYVSINTQVLGMVLRRATNQTLASFLEENIWSKVGFEYSARWCLDNKVDRMELAFGVLSITTRDYARFGWLMLNRGLSPSTGERILSEGWVEASHTPSGPHLMPGVNNRLFGYGYQWWVGPSLEDPSIAGTDYFAIGIYGQMLYISVDHGIVIAKNAANPHFVSSASKPAGDFIEGFYAMREIARHYSSV